jgi:prepilin-type N-terminal cleavage/methylation domain-containing protein
MMTTRAPRRVPSTRRRPLLLSVVQRREDGFTMVELVVSIFIFGIVITGIAAGMTSSLNLTRQNRNRSVAANLASQEMDTVRSTPFTSLTIGASTPQTVGVDGVNYTVTRESEWVTPNATSGPCQAPAGSSLAYLSVVVSVTWDNMNGVAPPRSQTVITPPVGTYDEFSGHVAVMVRDASAVGQEGVPVTLNGPSGTSTQTTTTDGCAFFAYQPAGAYTVTLSKSGFVSDQGVTAPSQSASVQVGSTVSLQFQYAAAATLNLTLLNAGGAALPTSPGVPVSLGNSHLLPAGAQVTTGTGATRSITGLFPYVDGYQTWAGACSDADPQGIKPTGGAFYLGASRTAPITVTEGATSTGTVAMPAITVKTQTTAAVARGSVQVTATHVVPAGATSDPGCPTAETYVLGTTNATTGLITTALPYGTWKISAAGTSTTVNQQLSPLVGTTPTVTIAW